MADNFKAAVILFDKSSIGPLSVDDTEDESSSADRSTSSNSSSNNESNEEGGDCDKRCRKLRLVVLGGVSIPGRDTMMDALPDEYDDFIEEIDDVLEELRFFRWCYTQV